MLMQQWERFNGISCTGRKARQKILIFQRQTKNVMYHLLITFFVLFLSESLCPEYRAHSFSAVAPLAKITSAKHKKKWGHGISQREFQNALSRSILVPLLMTPTNALDVPILPEETMTLTTSTPHLLSVLNVQGGDETFALTPQMTVIVFIIGIIPFAIATYEFWRRIAVGAPFGTGSDSVLFPNNVTIGMDDVSPLSSRGKQVLGTDSLITAYVIFATVGVILGIVFYAILTSPIPN
jgi:hypothetical protein